MKSKPEIKNDAFKFLLAKGIVSNEVKDYSNTPFFIKKAAAAKKRVDKVGFPKEFLATK